MYIRTKDGRIVDTTKYPEHPASWGVQASDYALTIKQSETIEELCDEFVGFEDGCIPFVWRFDTIDKYRERDLFIKEILENKGTEETIYGCIWTDKGLIYVAKMDSEGKLELI